MMTSTTMAQLSKTRSELVGKRFLFVPSRRCKIAHLMEADEEESAAISLPMTTATTSTRSRGGEDKEDKLKLSRVADWNWVSGVIRCANTRDDAANDLQVRQGTTLL